MTGDDDIARCKTRHRDGAFQGLQNSNHYQEVGDIPQTTDQIPTVLPNDREGNVRL